MTALVLVGLVALALSLALLMLAIILRTMLRINRILQDYDLLERGSHEDSATSPRGPR